VQFKVRIFVASRASQDGSRIKEREAFGLIKHLWFLRGWRTRHRKNRDKQMQFIVRVMVSS